MSQSRDKDKKNICPYCGDAPESHVFLYINNVIARSVEPIFQFLARHSPGFLRHLAEYILRFFFRTAVFLGFIKFSSNINLALTLRSKVIWEEAQRRGLEMEQAIAFGRPTEHFRVRVGGKYYYFDSLPISENNRGDDDSLWDDKFYLKKKFSSFGIPVPNFLRMAHWERFKDRKVLNRLTTPLIVKPAIGSRGRHTTTNIRNEEHLRDAIKRAFIISPVLIAEEHLEGYVCRATIVDGELVGFYRGEAPFVLGDGVKKIRELIEEKNQNRPESVSNIELSPEALEFIKRSGYSAEDILPKETKLFLTHRIGRYFGGRTREMLSDLHPSFVPILEKAGKATELGVLGFDCIVPDPEIDQGSQRWGIIECNTLPFIDLHYFAFEGEREKNIAGAIWDLFLKNLV